MILFLGLFFVSGFCSLVYEVVWLRLAMGVFGVTAPFVSIFLSVFMAGLGLGSWGAGRLCRRLESKPACFTLRLYAGAELLIALSALAAPLLLTLSRRVLERSFGLAAWDSAGYYWASGLCTTLALLPWCACMGATFPLAMAAIEKRFAAKSKDSFSFLYLCNVIGAAFGALLSAFVLIEIFGFHRTLAVASGLNVSIAAVALFASVHPSMSVSAGLPRGETPAPRAAPSTATNILPQLFMVGLVSMAMEVIWTRQYTPFLGNSVYAFALILGGYLLASFAGSSLYRSMKTKGIEQCDVAWMLAGAIGLLPVYAANPYLMISPYARIGLGIMPYCGLMGYLTPALIDRWSSGNPGRAGTAYAVNVLGCILGPLIAGFLLLPWIEERFALTLLALPLFAAGLRAALRQRRGTLALGRLRSLPLFAIATGLAALLVVFSSTFEGGLRTALGGEWRLERDYQATVTAAGQGPHKNLLVNGIGMTTLTPLTKVMAHLPLAFLDRPPKNALVICFGMGTTFRSLVSWGIPSTAVELVPSVPRLFGFFHNDAEKVMASPNARVVIDDGRRFLTRSTETFDVITMDPAPPMSAAGTSFLYSEEFYSMVKERLSPDGIMQQWIMEPMEPVVLSAFAKAIKDSFPYIRVFRSVQGWGFHCIASRRPIPAYTAAVLTAHLPSAAAKDLVEFGPHSTAGKQFQALLSAEVSIDTLISPNGKGLTDDHPLNEYFLLRSKFAKK